MMEQKENITTEVTSVALEEEKTGNRISLPNEEEIANRALSSFILNRKKFSEVFSTLSARGKTRVMNAVLELPTEGLPVYLKDDNEKSAFLVGQRLISDRFILTQYHITQELRKRKQKQDVEENQKEAIDNSSSES